ncbi:Uu.00g090810.m01.CDS01 [Anthostomella pinea]|uniref:Uu.00g090810.m01.CDS01 n=1 Tax=Anthostomella pinea TaxID=933095 RepID=A0AAI8VMZ8_9PEZI|nr:Uu.00g090810.m01.CDS01 [Anthostomella pinea]
MSFPKSFIGKLCFLLLSCSTTFAAPVAEPKAEIETSVVRRAGGSKGDPVDASFDITGWENIAEEDCYVMLQRGPTANSGDSNRRDSGVNLRPFQANQLATRHTSQIMAGTVSAEEFPWASTQNGGSSAYVLPATLAEQNVQKTGISAGYRRTGGPGYGEWFRISFTGPPHGRYCAALFSNPQDFSVCGNTDQTTIFGVSSVVLANFVYQVVTAAQPYIFHHAAGNNKGTKRTVDIEEVVVRHADDEVSTI